MQTTAATAPLKITTMPDNDAPLSKLRSTVYVDSQLPPADRRAVANRAVAQLGLKVDSLTWSLRAGCSCGCSPGFILRSQDRAAQRLLVFVDIAS